MALVLNGLYGTCRSRPICSLDVLAKVRYVEDTTAIQVGIH